MFGRTPKKDDREVIEPVMTRILTEMEMFGPDSEEYPALLSHLERIVALRASKEKRMPSPDTMILAAGNLLGILIIVKFEQMNVMTSKAISFVVKPK